jgi:hypothetical protein
MQSDEYKKSVLVADAVFERWETAQLKLKRRLAILDSGPPFCVPIEVAEADVEKAKREVAEAEHEMRVMRGDFDGSKLMSKELRPTQTAIGDLSDMKTEHEREAEQFWFYNVSLELEHWATLADVSAREAAMLLCLHNPRKRSFEDADTVQRPDLPDGHLERLDRKLSDYAAQNPRPYRSLLGWYSAAQALQIKLAPEAVSFMGYVAAKSNATPAPVVDGINNAPSWTLAKPERLLARLQQGGRRGVHGVPARPGRAGDGDGAADRAQRAAGGQAQPKALSGRQGQRWRKRGGGAPG